MKKRIFSLFLILVMILTCIPADLEVVFASDDGFVCGICERYIYGDYVCDDCGNHSPASGDDCATLTHCNWCGDCFANKPHCENGSICIDCALSEGFHCVECEECFCIEEGAGLCGECFRCESCVDICPDCGFCEDCATGASDTHCKLCGQCYSTVGDCVDGGQDHCEDCCKVCENCGECLTEEETEFCDVCGLCVDCCLENAADEGCSCEEYCVESGEWASHICDNCGQCFDEIDQCDICGYCMDCCEAESECSQGMCVESDEYESHFCQDCGSCFDEVDECDSCIENGELRCTNCCEEYRLAEGCDCTDICVSDSDFEDHLTEAHADKKGQEHTKSPQKYYSVDVNYHWYNCSFCDETEHISGKELHTYNSVGVCKVCGYKKGAEVFITMQPKDATVLVADIDGEGTGNSDAILVLTKTFSIKASGKGKLTYQWYSKVEGVSDWKPVVNTDNIEDYCGNAKSGATSDTVEIYSTETLCAEPVYLYCVVTDEAGHTATSAPVTLYGKHNYSRITNVKDKSASKITYKYINDKNEVKTVEFYPSLGHNFECVGNYNHSSGGYKYYSPRKHTYKGAVLLGKLYSDSNVKVYKNTCEICNNTEYFTTHIHSWEVDMDATDAAGASVYKYGHVMSCTYAGCDQTKTVLHNYGAIKTQGIPYINSDGSDHPAGYYRECKDCEYKDDITYVENGENILWSVKKGTVILSGSDTKTSVSRKIAKAGNKITLKYNAKDLDGKKCTGWKVTYYYLENPRVDREWTSKDVTEVFDGNWAINMSADDPTTFKFIMPSFGEFGFDASEGGKMVFTPILANCVSHTTNTKVINQRPVSCLSDGYTGDEVCVFCGMVVKQGKYIECAHKHTGTLSLLPGTSHNGDCTKTLASLRYSYEGDYMCSACGLTVAGKRTKEHNNVVSKNDGVAATCTTTGLTNTTYCTACGKTVKKQKTIPVTHKNTKTIGAVAWGCNSTGFSGKIVCKDCGAMVDAGHYTKALGHTGGTATCTAKKQCTRCGESYGSHASHTTEVQNLTKATLNNNGNTGNTVCTVCEKTVKSGTVVYSPSSFKLNYTSCVYDGKAKKPTVTVTDSKGNTIASTNYSLSYTDKAGTAVTSPVNVGTYNAKIVFTGNYSGTKSISYTIKQDAGATVSISFTSKAYTGSEIKPVVTVKNSAGTAMKSGTDYAVAFLDSAGKSATPKAIGTYTVKVTMKGNYSGSATKTYKIIPKTTTIGTPALASDGITVKWTKNTSCTGYYIYRSINGAAYKNVKKITSNSTVSWKDTGAKTNGTKYQYKIIAYKTVSGTNYNSAYSGIKTIFFLSKPAISGLTNVSGKKMTVKWGKNAKGTGYQIQYGLKSDFSNAKSATVTSNATVSKTITGLTKGKTYYVRIRTYKTDGSTKYYSEWSAKKSVKITK